MGSDESVPSPRETLAESFYSARRHPVAIVLSTKDRPELTRRTLTSLVGEGDFDLLWLDDSRTPEGRALVRSGGSIANLREVHLNVVGGPDAAIVCALSRMYELGYDYCGLIENDVKLAPGWFPRLMSLFDKGHIDGLNLGAVTARTIEKRVLFERPEYCVMFNAGAGMILLSRQATRIVLDAYRTTTTAEVRDVFLTCTGRDISRNWELRSPDAAKTHYRTSVDWFYDAALQLHGLCTLAPVPTFAENVDADLRLLLGSDYVTSSRQSAAAEDRAFEMFVSLHQRRASAPPDLYALAHTYAFEDPSRMWTVYPHQMLRLGASLDGAWRLQWTQGYGPFTYRTDQPGSAFSFDVLGDSCLLVLGYGPDAGAIDVDIGDGRLQADLYVPAAGLRSLGLEFPSRGLRRVTCCLTDRPNPAATGNVLRWAAVQFPAIQPWFAPVDGFNYADIGGLITIAD